MTYDEFFQVFMRAPEDEGRVVERLAAYRYQCDLAEGSWPDMLDIPTGLGKTAAITGAWLYRRLEMDLSTPRRLVWCLPMRVLVEQVHQDVRSWIDRVTPLFEERGQVAPRVYVLMGGETEDDWVRRPEDPAVLVGTQDMLLSRALMRGYGPSRYRWPIDFALLHNDALWVFDEVQLMGAGLPTSAQLEAFRRSPLMPVVLPCRSLWSSATLRPDWLGTVDFQPHLAGCRVLRLPREDRSDPRVQSRLSAPKRLVKARSRLSGARKADMKSYVESLAGEVVESHAGDGPTLVIVNRVARAQEICRRVRRRLDEARAPTSVLLVHARFRSAERSALNARLRELGASDDVIVVATQAVEAGIDLTSRRLFTELAPWPSVVQRFGRCNRGGEYEDAVVHWIDLEGTTDPQLALPYTPGALGHARDLLGGLNSASSADLPPVEEGHPAPHVLRRKDLLDLYNTEPDLSGFDIDISSYLRDPGGADVRVFWREFDDPDDEPRPERQELCAAPIGAVRDHLRALKRAAYAWHTLERRWTLLDRPEDARPGQVLMLHADAGGYDPDLGFVSGLRGTVEPVRASELPGDRPESMDGDPMAAGDFLELGEHLLEARRQAVALAEALPMADGGDAVVEAALWHDVGKAHPAFQTAILLHAGDEVDRSRLWAKSPEARRRLDYGVPVDSGIQRRRHFRHELASALAWLEVHGFSTGLGGAGETPAAGVDPDLAAYLIAAHHGKVRVVLRALPNETEPPDGRLYARGVWDGDELPSLAVNGMQVPALRLRLDLMQIGEGEMGPSWSARTAGLLERWGPFRLAWLETMVRLADWRASAAAVPASEYDQPTQPRNQVRERAAAFGAPGSQGALDPAVLDEIVRRVLEVTDAQRIVLFGSAARGEMGADSDVDLLVILSNVEHRRRLAQEIYMNLSGVGVPVDVVVATPEDVKRIGVRVGSILLPALHEGRTIHGG